MIRGSAKKISFLFLCLFSLIPSTAQAGHPIYIQDGPPGYLAVPENFEDYSKVIPAVLIIHDWWGLTARVQEMADDLAEKGFLTFAVDLYYGEVAYESVDAQRLMRSMKRSLAMRDLKQSTRFLYEYTDLKEVKIAVVGWSMGADLAMALAQVDTLYTNALVLAFGGLTSHRGQLRSVKVPIFGIYASDDSSLPRHEVKSFDFDLQQLNKRAEIITYPDTRADFMDPTGPHYDIHASQTAWHHLLLFLKSNLA